ncbi:hypothetical protein Plec18170_005379 [Paecilomyces lecythidis]
MADQIAWALSRIRSSRILKPRSAGNSPRAAARRRTVAHGPMQQYRQRQSQVYRTPTDDALLSSAYQDCRPMSWHPGSQQAMAYNDMSSATYPAPANDISQIQQSFIPSTNCMDDLSSYPVTGNSMADPDFSTFQIYRAPSGNLPCDFSQLNNSSSVDPVSWNMDPSGFSCVPQDSTQGYAFDGMPMTDAVPTSYITDFGQESVQSSDDFTGPPTPDFLPIQQFSDNSASCPDLTSKPESSADELVGVGLYDEPDTSLVSEHSLLGGFNETRGPNGKGLKLEETFTPSDDEEDGEGDEDEGDEEAKEDEDNQPGPQSTDIQHSVQEKEMFDQSVNAATNMLGKSFLFDEPEDMMVTSLPECPQMMGVSEIPCSNLGYGWI